MPLKILPTCDGCGIEAEEIELTVEELDDYQADDLSNDLESPSVDDNDDWGVYWGEDEEHKIYCPNCKAYKIK